MDRIQQVGLPNPVPSADADDPFGKLVFLVKVIFELEQ